MSHQPLPVDHGPAAGTSTPAEAVSAAAPEAEEFQPDQLPRALFGYHRSTIVELLGTLSRRIKSLTQERTDRDRRIAELEATIKQLEARIKQNEENHRLIGEALVAAREEANTIRENARQSAEQVLRAARSQVDLILEESELEARVQAKEIVE